MIGAISIELLKARKLRLGILAVGIAIVIAVLSTFSLLSSPLPVEEGAKPTAWYNVILSLVFFSGLMWPLFTSIVASRQVENEQDNGGWILMSLLGVHPSKLIVAKLVVAFLCLLICVAVEIGVVLVLGRFGGVVASLEPQVFVYGIGLLAIGTLWYCFSFFVAAWSQSAFYTLTFGLINSFTTAFLMLIELPFNEFLPWAYYGFISPVKQVDDDLQVTTVPVLQIVIFILVSTGILVWGSNLVTRSGKG